MSFGKRQICFEKKLSLGYVGEWVWDVFGIRCQAYGPNMSLTSHSKHPRGFDYVKFTTGRF